MSRLGYNPSELLTRCIYGHLNRVWSSRRPERTAVERPFGAAKMWIGATRFPTVKNLNSFDFKAIPSLNKMLVLELARCDYITRHENIIAVGNSGTGKTHIVLGLGLAACPMGPSLSSIRPTSVPLHMMTGRHGARSAGDWPLVAIRTFF